MCRLVPEVWSCAGLCQRFEVWHKKIVLNYTNYNCTNIYTTPWPHELRRKYAEIEHFGGPWVRILAQTKNMTVIFFCTDFCTIFLCIYVCNTKGDAHKQCGPPKREGKLILSRLGKDLAHCAKLLDVLSIWIRQEQIISSLMFWVMRWKYWSFRYVKLKRKKKLIFKNELFFEHDNVCVLVLLEK